MNVDCPYCQLKPDYISDFRNIRRKGHFHRTSDSKDLQRYLCLQCKRGFSQATHDDRYWQKKRQKNLKIWELLASGVSQRRTARLLRINRKMVARRLKFFGEIARHKLAINTASSKVIEFEFDDLETFEHSKCKPVSVILAVEAKTRRILGLRVARMGAKGTLTKKSLRLYGKIKDERGKMRKELFKELSQVVLPGAIIRSDSNPYYVRDVKSFFPKCTYVTVKGMRGAVTGQGELKKVGFDPIFSLNHTCAMFRANVARLIRKTWCTTKKAERLADHLAIYSVYHNENLKVA